MLKRIAVVVVLLATVSCGTEEGSSAGSGGAATGGSGVLGGTGGGSGAATGGSGALSGTGGGSGAATGGSGAQAGAGGVSGAATGGSGGSGGEATGGTGAQATGGTGAQATGGSATGGSGGVTIIGVFEPVDPEAGGPTGGDLSPTPWPEPTGNAVPIAVGSGSYASEAHAGVADREIYVVDPNQAIPTNDWWTQLVVNEYGGSFPAYPMWVRTSASGISLETQVAWQPAGGDENGRHVERQGELSVGASGFSPPDARALSWSDWGLVIQLEESATESMRVTIAHGLPFVWVETTGLSPVISGGDQTFDESGNVSLPVTGDHIGVTSEGVSYGIFAPDGTTFSGSGGNIQLSFSGAQQFVVIASMPSQADLPTFYATAYAIPRRTQVDWDYQPGGGRVVTRWSLENENLKGEASLDTIQCWIPHHYKKTARDFEMNGIEYFSARGTMQCATGSTFHIAWPMRGIPAKLPVPEVLSGKPNPYVPDRMAQQIEAWADRTGYGGDTYWGGKDVLSYAKYMNFAYETGNTAAFETLRSTLRGAMEDWFTYTPGENNHYFALYPRWGGLVGFGTSYTSENFTDHHFHYGYFTYAAGLLAMYDEEFAAGYGEMATLVAKEYANYNRDDTRFPMFRTFDPWMGHSYAGGTGQPEGNNQESSSEAMQSWIGMYVLGTALGNKAMRDAGAFGYSIEAQACAEYWFDRDGTNFPDNWPHTVSTVVRPDHIGYWTYFSGDPIWKHAILWLPIAPGFYYLVEDYDYAEMEFWGVMADTGNSVIPDSWNSGLGNVALGYWQLFDPDGAAVDFDRMWDSNSNVVHNTDTGGISYYYLHSNRMLGRVNWNAWTNLPTSMVYSNAETGERSVGAHNPWDQDVEVSVYEAGAAQATFTVPAGTLIRQVY